MRALTLCGCIVLTGVLAALPSRIERATIVTPAMSRGASTSDSVDARTRAALLASRDAIWRAWFANDTAALARLLPRSTTAGEQRGWQNRDEILADARRAAESGQKLVGIHFDNTRIYVNGDVAVLFSDYSLDVSRNGKRTSMGGNASEVFVRVNGAWVNPFWYLGPH